MPRLEPTPELIANILTRIPEAFIRYDMLCQRVRMDRNTNASLVVGNIARDGEWWYDSERLTQEQVRERKNWGRPQLPAMQADGQFHYAPIREQLTERDYRINQLANSRSAQQLLEKLAENGGHCRLEKLRMLSVESTVLDEMIARNVLSVQDEIVYDPLLIGQRTAKQIATMEKVAPVRDEIVRFLREQPGQTTPEADMVERFGAYAIDTLLAMGSLRILQVDNGHNQIVTWLRPVDSDANSALDVATESVRLSWERLLQSCGTTLRPGAKDGRSARLQVLARSYTLSSAAQRLGIRQNTLQKAMNEDRIEGFEDPEGHIRLPADAVEAAFSNPEYAEHITAFEQVTYRDIAMVIDVKYGSVRRGLQKIGIKSDEPRWGQVRGQLDLPDTYREYKNILKEKTETFQNQRRHERDQQEQGLAAERKAERERRAALRARLVAAFPTWQHAGRADQRIVLHVGPPNSGKTHAALESLVAAESGWYLAPLRLLAFEIFDRLNQRGVLCNLLTGEEHITIPGANITAATVEMFSPIHSGTCVVIDEAQMLADADRGWAWTRAVMEAEAANIHVIGPQTVHGLIEQMANAAAIPLEVVEHERLAPIRIADSHWSLETIPSRTILVAFSRALVLHLKTELERMKRTVSVVYGNLPPEVRRKQADRFANGETEICVATDAVGMGLNLPADFVCFYEVEKFDGRNVRVLTPAEVQQIGGRAGRYGLSTVGEVGATSKRDLRLVKKLFYEPAEILTHARVAPTVEDLELIPGNLASKLTQWSQLQSIPEALRRAIQTADMSERIELASMLTDREVNLLGLEAALKIVNAPTRQNTRDYWYQCAHHILIGKSLPMPPVAPMEITNTIELESIEYCIACADIYLWLSQRREFGSFAPHGDEVREMRADWSVTIDGALLRKINTMKRCSRCGKPLPIKHRYAICDNCFFGHTHAEPDDLD